VTTGAPDASLEGEGGTLTPGAGGAISTEIAARSPWQLFWRRLKEDKVALGALAFIVLLILLAIFAPLVVKLVGARGPTDQSTKYLDSFGRAARTCSASTSSAATSSAASSTAPACRSRSR
jgi:peptide/nickel transport system permease protein